MRLRDAGLSLGSKANATTGCRIQPRKKGECDYKMRDTALEVRRMRLRDAGFSIGSKANATTRCGIQPSK